MKKLTKIFSLVVALSLLAYASLSAQSKKTKVALIHNGHIIVVAPEAVPAHLAHGDTYADESNTFTITIVNDNPSLGTISGPMTVASGDSAVYTIVPNDGYNFTLLVDGTGVYSDNVAATYTLLDVTAPHTVEVTFYTLN
ncbi:MAG TPA: hypothetical protein VI758_01165 [Bacteroidota bacterium]